MAPASAPAQAPAVRAALSIDALQVEGYADRGVGRYVQGYAGALARRGRLAAALVAPELPPPRGLPPELAGTGLTAWDQAGLPRALLGRPGRLVWHVTAPFLHSAAGDPAGLAVPEHWARAPVPRVVLLYDLIPLRAPRHYLSAPGAAERYRQRARWVGASDLVLTISSHTRDEAMVLLGCEPERVVDVGTAASPFFSPPDGTDEELWRFRCPQMAERPFVLLAGGGDARKGTDRAVAALELLVARGLDLGMVVVGHLDDLWRRRLGEAAAACGVADRVLAPAAVDDELLRAAYRRAAVTLMPSLAEGAGLPVLESAACGTPALASAATALIETAATPEALFDPTSVDGIAVAVERLLTDRRLRDRVLARQRAVAQAATWDRVADRAVEAMDLVIGAQPPHPAHLVRPGRAGSDSPGAPPPPVPRVALVGWRERFAEAADLPRGLSDALGASVDVFGFRAGGRLPGVDREEAAAASGTPAAWSMDLAAFGSDARPASYDHVVYCLDGPGAPPPVWALAGRHPGWLWLASLEGPAPLEPLVRRSHGVVLDARHVAGLRIRHLRAGAAVPPLLVLDGTRPAASGLAAGLIKGLAERLAPGPGVAGSAGRGRPGGSSAPRRSSTAVEAPLG